MCTDESTCWLKGEAGSDQELSVWVRLPLGSASIHFTLYPASCTPHHKHTRGEALVSISNAELT